MPVDIVAKCLSITIASAVVSHEPMRHRPVEWCLSNSTGKLYIDPSFPDVKMLDHNLTFCKTVFPQFCWRNVIVNCAIGYIESGFYSRVHCCQEQQLMSSLWSLMNGNKMNYTNRLSEGICSSCSVGNWRKKKVRTCSNLGSTTRNCWTALNNYRMYWIN